MGSMGKPGGMRDRTNDAPTRKYDGPTIDASGMSGDDLYMTCKYVGTRGGPHYNVKMRGKVPEPMGKLVVGRGQAFLINVAYGGAALDWQAVNAWGEEQPDQAAAVDAWLEFWGA